MNSLKVTILGVLLLFASYSDQTFASNSNSLPPIVIHSNIFEVIASLMYSDMKDNPNYTSRLQLIKSELAKNKYNLELENLSLNKALVNTSTREVEYVFLGRDIEAEESSPEDDTHLVYISFSIKYVNLNPEGFFNLKVTKEVSLKED